MTILEGNLIKKIFYKICIISTEERSSFFSPAPIPLLKKIALNSEDKFNDVHVTANHGEGAILKSKKVQKSNPFKKSPHIKDN